MSGWLNPYFYYNSKYVWKKSLKIIDLWWLYQKNDSTSKNTGKKCSSEYICSELVVISCIRLYCVMFSLYCIRILVQKTFIYSNTVFLRDSHSHFQTVISCFLCDWLCERINSKCYFAQREKRTIKICCPSWRNATFILDCTVFD